MPIKIGGVTLEHIIIDSVEMSKIDIGATTVFELVSNYTVNFIANGSIVSTKTVAAGGTTTLPSNPSRSNWTFVKWVYGVSNTQFTTSTVVNSNINVYAYWSKYEYVGTIKCNNCDGTGRAYEWRICDTCYGAGTLGGVCPECDGNGGSKEYGDCSYCNNTGFAPCMTCDGNGGYYSNGDCSDCGGSGVVDDYDYIYEAY